MKPKIFFLSFLFLFTQLLAQKPPIESQRDSAVVHFDGKEISINYGKLRTGDKKIFGSYVPYYRVWRTGSGAATTLRTEVDLEIDGAIVPKGMYTLYTLPTENRWKLIINKQTGQWGTVYNAQYDLARIDLTIKKIKTRVNVLIFKLEKTGDKSGILKIELDTLSLSIPFHVHPEGIVPSPRDSVELLMSGKRISVNYGRPSMRGRKIMGVVVPYGIVWRTGANEATSFITETDLVIGNYKIPKGGYTLYTLPSKNQWKLIINKQTGQWGTVYNKELDLARIPLKKTYMKEPVEKFTILLEKKTEKKGKLILMWEKTKLWVDFEIK